MKTIATTQISRIYQGIIQKSAGLVRVLGVLCLIAICQTVSAQTFSVVGNGTASNSTTTYPAPFGQYYYGARHQFLVTAAQLSAAGVASGATISSIGFDVSATNSSAAHNGFQIKVYSTTVADPLSSAYLTTGLVAQTVAATVTPVAGWNQITLSASFVWDGTSNLVIETCFNNSGYSVNASTRWTTNLSGATYSRYRYADATGVCTNTTTTATSLTTRPNIRFGWTGASPTPPGCSTMTGPANGSSGHCAGSNQVTLTWNAPTSGGAPTGYKLYLGTSNTSPPNNVINGTNVGNVTSYLLPTNLNANTTYYWRIVPTNSYGDATCSTNFSFATATPCTTATVGVSNGTSTDIHTPFSTYWEDGRHQYLLTAAELSAAGLGVGNMRSLAFNVASWNGLVMNGFNIRMANVSTTNLTSTFQAPSFTTVFSGNYSVPGTGWRTFNFSTNFAWNGTSNVLVEVCFNNTSYSSSSQVNITNTGHASTTYRYADGQTGCTMTGTGTANARPQMQIFGAALMPPGCATLSTPSNGASGVCYNGLGANLTWTAPGTGGVPSGYKIYFGTNNPPSNIQNGSNIGNTLNWNTNTLAASTTYYWRVVPTNGAGDASSCNTVFSFTTASSPCIVPDCASYTAPANGATSVSANGTNLTWTAPTTGGVPTGYKVYFGTNNPPTNLVNGTNIGNVLTWNTGALSPLTLYYWRIVPTNSTGDAVSCAVRSFTTGNVYCQSYATSTADTRIGNVTIGSINNTSPTSCQTYTDYTNLSTNLTIGNQVTISVSQNSCGLAYGSYWSVFIDYNQDMDFNDPGELVGSFGSTNGSFTANSINFTIPLNATPGNTRLRVVLIEDIVAPTNPCATYTWGETEDYTVNLVLPPAPACAGMTIPTNGATGICYNGNGPSLNWTAPTSGGPLTGYKVYLGTNNPPTNIQNGTNVGNVLTWSTGALSASTTYYWRIVPTGPGGDAVSCSVYSFTTAGTACVVPGCAAAYTAPANNANPISVGGTTLTWTAPVTGGPPTGYKIYFGTNNPPTNIQNGFNNGLSLSWPSGNLSPFTTYYWRIVPTNGTGDATGCNTVYSFTTGPDYCASYAINTDDTRIANVTFGSVNNTSPNSCQTYTNYTNLSSNVTLGNQLTVSVSQGSCGLAYGSYWSVFIDYNQDVDFNDPGELVGSFGSTGGLFGANSITFTIPLTAMTGSTRMRVVLIEGTTAPTNPCTTYSWGETEDYTLNILPPPAPSCAGAYTSPVNNAVNVCPNNAPFSWTAATGAVAGYKFYLGTNNPPSNLINGTNLGDVLSHVVGSLATSTTYYWRVVPTGPGGDASSCSVFSFTTASAICPVPNCLTSYSSPANGTSGINSLSGIQLTWNAPTSGPTPTGYKVYLGTNNPPTNLANGQDIGNNTYVWFIAPQPNTTYYWRIVPYATGGDAVSCNTVYSFSTGSGYCTPAYIYGTGDGDYVGRVSIGSLNNITAGAGSPYYTYYSNVAVPLLQQNSSQTLIVSPGTWATSNVIAAWIDFNQNGVFESNEKIGEVPIGGAYPTTDSINFTVPRCAPAGFTRMRVREVYAGSSIDPCLTYSYGETEDYNVEIQALLVVPSCATLSSPAHNTSGVLLAGTNLTWTAPVSGACPTGYKLYFGTNNPPTNIVNGSPLGDVTTAATGTLNPSTTYYWRIVPYNNAGDASGCNTVNAFTSCSFPAQPVANAATGIQCYQFTANWAAASGASAYILDVATDIGFTQMVSGYNGLNVGNVTSRNVTGLSIGTAYYYRVYAFNACGNGLISGTIPVSTTPVPVTPAVLPGNAPACQGFAANWSSVTYATAYLLTIATDNGFSNIVSGYNALNVGNISTYGVTGLSPNTTYYYRVQATNTCGTSAVSATSSGNTSPLPAFITLNTGTNSQCTAFDITWTASLYATDYILDVATDNLFTQIVSGYNNLNVGNVTSSSITGLVAGTTYYVRVRGNNSCGMGNYSNTESGTTLPVASVPVSAGASNISCDAFDANWAPALNVTNYRLDVASDAGFSNILSGYNNLNVGNVTTHRVNGLSLGTPYYYRVKGENTCTTSSVSQTVTTITYNLQDSLQLSSNTPVCENGMLSMTATTFPGVSYLWTGPGAYTSNSGIANLTGVQLFHAGEYTVVASFPGCPDVNGNLQVVVNEPVTQVNLGGNTPLCSGETLILTSSGGHTNSTYSWTGPNGFSDTSQNTSLVSISQADSGTFTVSIHSPGCNTMSNTVSVQVIPSITMVASNNGPVCEGSPIYITATFIPGSPYNWTGPNGFVSSLRSPAISPATIANSGIYTLHFNQPGCNPLSYTTQVYVGSNLSNLTITNNMPVCNSQTLSLSATQYPNTSYSWTGPNGFTANTAVINIPNASPADNGNYAVTATTQGCSGVTRTQNVTIYSSLTPVSTSNSPVCHNSSITLSTQNYSGATYAWAGPNGFTSNVRVPFITYAIPNLHTGEYTLTVTQPGCGTATTTTSVMVGGTLGTINAISNSPLCSGTTLALTSTPVENATVLWTGPDGFTSSNPNPVINNVSTSNAGQYTFTITSPGCGSAVRNPNVIINDPFTVAVLGVQPFSVCEGSNYALHSTTRPGLNNVWTGPQNYTATGRSVSLMNVTPAMSGQYTVTVNVPGCGVTSDIAQVIIGPSLNNLSPTVTPNACLGGTVNLNVQNVSGVQYDWSGPNGFTSNNTSESITNITSLNAGYYTLTVSSPGCGTLSFENRVIISNPSAITASSNTPVCGGGELRLSGTGNRGASFQWFGPNNFYSTQGSPTISNAQIAASGTYTLWVNDPSCGLVQRNIIVEVGANLNTLSPTNSGPICDGNPVNFASQTFPGASYSWAGPGGFNSTIQNPFIANARFADAGVYSVTVTTAGCLPLTRTTSLVVNPEIVSNPSSNAPVCQGGALYFNANYLPNVQYLWTGPNGFSSTSQSPSLVNVQPTITGNYTLTISRPGCTPASTATFVEVGANLNTLTAISNSPLCTGSTLNLSASNQGGFTYAWTGPAGFASTVQNPQIIGVDPSNTGSYVVVVSSPGCSNATRTLNVSVNSAPTITPGSNSPVCQGGVLYLSTNSITGASYAWQGPNGFIANAQSPAISSVTTAAAGIYTLTLTTQSCGAISNTTTVMIGASLSNIAATSNSPVCVGSDLNLSATLRSGYTYTWSGPAGFAATDANATNPNVSSANAGAYTVTFHSPGCGTATRTANVIVNNPASVTANNSGPVCVNGNVYFSGSVPSGSSYNWTGPAGFYSTSLSPARTALQLSHAGLYSLNATVPGCGSVIQTTNVVVNVCRENETFIPNAEADAGATQDASDDAGLSAQTIDTEASLHSDVNGSSLVLWPNPNPGDDVHLKWEGLSEKDNTITVKLFDATGKLIMINSVKRSLSSSQWEEQLKFPVKLAKGIYTLESVHDGTYHYQKLIIE
jgi:hypothetical protein